MNESLIWHTRAFIYKHFADTARPPSVQDTAEYFEISVDEADALYHELHARHAIYLEPSTASHQPSTIRMANPFSAVPTDFKVHATEKTYFANCAWDMLGIPAALHSDATIDAAFTGSDERLQIKIEEGRLLVDGMPVVHFPLPFARWYDDLVYT